MASNIVPPHHSNIPVFVQKNSLILYFGAACLISWVFWFIEPTLRIVDPITAGILIQIGTYGPVMAAMAVSAICDPVKLRSPMGLRLAAGGLVLALALYVNWPLMGKLTTDGAQPGQWLLLAAVLLLPAWVFFNAHSSLRGVQSLLKTLAQVRINPLWFGVALLFMLGLSVTGVLLTSLFTGQALSSWIEAVQNSQIMRNLALTFVATALYGGPVGEEPGWRGFALPRLQQRFDPLLASVLLGTAWALWHLPLHLSGYYDQTFGNAVNGLLMRAFTTIPLTIIFTWLYNRTKGSLLVMVVLHTAVNITSGLISPGTGMFITTALAVVVVVVIDRMYRKAPEVEEQSPVNPQAGLAAGS